MRSSVGWIVMPSLHGAIFPLVTSIDLEHSFSEQDIEPGSSAYADNAPSYCVHAPLVTSTL
jgi:hypothetical protein